MGRSLHRINGFCAVPGLTGHVMGYPLAMSRAPRRLAGMTCSFLQEVERTLIGFERQPPADVVHQDQWEEDAMMSYCPRCGASVELFGDGDLCCTGSRRACERVVRLGAYQGSLAEWLRAVKFGCWPGMARLLGSRLGRSIAVVLKEDARFASPIVVPVPMPLLRKWVRGIDHAQVLARAVAMELNAPLRQPLRQRSGRTQASRTASQRRRRRNPFIRRRWCRGLAGRPVVLIDDIATTGRTAMAAARVLKTAGAGEVLLGDVAVATSSPSRKQGVARGSGAGHCGYRVIQSKPPVG